MARIVLLCELVNARKRKASELAFYRQQKAELETALERLRRSIRLTDAIIAMIDREEIVDLTPARQP